MGSMHHMGGVGHAGPGVDYYGAGGAGAAGPTGAMQSGNVGGMMLSQGGFLSAFTAAPIYEGEPPLLEGRLLTHATIRCEF